MTAIFRCDATPDIGFGHLSRSIALAEAFRLSGVDCTFAGQFDDAAMDQIAASGFRRADFADPVNSTSAEQPTLASLLEPASFIIVDSYRVTPNYLSDLKSLGYPVVLIDDFGTIDTFPCDVILNFTWEARSIGYPKGPTLLLGPSFFPARRRLVERRQDSIDRQRTGPAGNLLIAIGGADPKRIAARLISILRAAKADLCIRVIAVNDTDLSDGMPDFAAGSAVLPRQPDLSDQFLWADACITGGGLIKYESAFMGVPAAAISQNEGQAEETVAFARAGLVFDLGLADQRTDKELAKAIEHFLADESLRNDLIDKCRKAFPTDPSSRAAGAILKAIGQ